MSVLEYASQVKAPESFEDEVVEAKSDKQEVQLAQRLIEGMTRDQVDLSEYKDLYTERMTELIEAKVEGKDVVAPPAVEEPAVINLMDALKKSVAQVTRPEARGEKPARKMAASRSKRPAKKGGRKKTG
jgi:DNA end-binding protein Ku